MDRRRAISARAQLLHAAAGSRGTAARDLHRLAHAQDARRPAGGAPFVLPGFIAILGLSMLYAGLRQLPAVAAVFFGLKAAVLAIVVEAVLRIGKRALKNRLMRGSPRSPSSRSSVLMCRSRWSCSRRGIFGFIGTHRALAFPSLRIKASAQPRR